MQESVIFKTAVKLPPAEQEAFLDQACGADAALRLEVEGLLRAHNQPGEFMHRPPLADMTTTLGPGPERPGMRIGPYKLLQFLGEGGMGVVFLAEQSEPVRRMVALKIIKPGMDSTQVLARFEAERQALALMDHPNIARVLDAGATEGEPGGVSPGRPYFVMELVKGVPITEFCDQNRLTTRQRLELFVPVCNAIQHAHMKGVIHRDVKPSNVLIALYDGKPVPKVIDFGVAKAMAEPLTRRTLFTQVGQIVGTFEYMAPEQATLNQLDIDTRSDIYSLGVLLYELLTGTTPLDKERLRSLALDQMLRTIREEEPMRPSARLSSEAGALATAAAYRGTDSARLPGVLRGELDWIVMKCLEKERDRRFVTAGSLAQDVERYLRDEPVTACPPTLGYRLRKFGRKHRSLLATTAAFVVLLLLGVTGSTWQAVRATQAEAVALANEHQASKNAAKAQAKEQEAKDERDEAQRRREEVEALNAKLKETQAQLRRILYAAHVNLVQHAWEAGAVERVRELLEQQRPQKGESDLRHFEWHYLNRLSHAELLTLQGPAGPYVVSGVAYSPDGKRLAGSYTRTGPYTAPERVEAAFQVKVWEAQTGKELYSLEADGPGVSFSPNGERLAVGSKVVDAGTGKALLTLKDRGCAAQFSPDGKHLVSTRNVGILTGPGEVKVWDAQTGEELLRIRSQGVVSGVAISPDGKRLAAATSTWDDARKAFVDQEVKVWDTETRKELMTLKGGAVTPKVDAGGVAYSPDGKRLANCSPDGQVKVWDAQSGEALLTLKGHTGYVARAVFSPDGKRLASVGADKTVKVWDAQSGEELLTLRGHTSGVGSVAFSPDGKRLASGDVKEVKIWDAQARQGPLALKGLRPQDIALSPDGQRLAGIHPGRSDRGDGWLKVWDLQTGKELVSIEGGGSRVAFSPDGNRLAVCTSDQGGTLKVYEAQSGKELLSVEAGGGRKVVFSPDGNNLVIASRDAAIVRDSQTGKNLLPLKGRAECVAYSPNGKRLAVGSRDPFRGNHSVTVWDVQTGKEVLSLKGDWRAAAFSPDGKRLASAGSDTAVTVWDAQSGEKLLTLKGHSGSVAGLAFGPDGRRLASTSKDGTVKVWDAQTGEELITLKGGGGSVAFTPDGHRLVAGAEDGTAMIWDATPLPEASK